MNIEKHLKHLAARVRGEHIAEIDVSGRVITLLRADPVPPIYAPERPLMWMAGLSSAVAVSAVVAALLLYFGGTADPLHEMMETVSWASLQ